MKQKWILSAALFIIAGTITGCGNCGSDNECDEIMEVEAVEIVPCNECHQKHKCKTLHKHNKNCKDITACKPAAACSSKDDKEGTKSGSKPETADCGNCENDDKKEHNAPAVTASTRKFNHN